MTAAVRHHIIRALAFALLVQLPGLSQADAQQDERQVFFDDLTAQQQRDILDRAFPLRVAIWQRRTIAVCWEDLSQSSCQSRNLVKRAVDESWAAASGLRFVGWQACTADSKGIRIAFRDEGPHTKTLGRFNDGKPDGMVLNASFQNWGRSFCSARKDECLYSITVHEFGHAIGFAHEQKRTDTPGECLRMLHPSQITGGTMGDDQALTPWDPESVMNYCNPEYNNGGQLTMLDKAAVAHFYGEP